MFEALKRMAPGGKSDKGRHPAEELMALLEASRRERIELTAVLAQIESRGAKVLKVGHGLEQVERQAAASGDRLADIDARLGGLDDRTRAIEDLSKRIETLSERTAKAEQLVSQVTSPTGEVTRHREMLQELASQALQAQAAVETLKRDRAALDSMRAEMRLVQADVKQSVDQMGAFKAEIEQVRATGAQLTQDYARLKDVSRDGQERAASTLDAVKEVEKKLERLDTLRALSRETEERLAALNALAEHVSAKTKALENQKSVIDRAVVETNRVNEMVWSMDAQIAKLTEAGKDVGRADELVARLETVAKETSAQLEAGGRAKDELAREVAKVQKDADAFTEFGRSHLERLGLLRKEFEAFDQRMRALQASVTDAEGRMDGLVARDKNLAALTTRMDALNKQADDLAARAEDMARRMTAVDVVADRLDQIDEMSKKATWQLEALKRTREDVETLRKEFQELSRLTVEAAQLSDRLGSDRAALEATADRLTAFRTDAAGMQDKLDAITGKLQLVDESARKAARFEEVQADIDRQMTRLNARIEFVTRLEERVNALHALGEEVNHKLETQLARRAEVDSMKTLLEGVAALAGDAQGKLDGVATLQAKLLPLATQVAALKNAVDKLEGDAQRLHDQRRAIAEHEKRLSEMQESARSVSTLVDERLRQIQGLSEEMKRATALRDELLAELSRTQGRQREVAAQVDASEDQVKRLESLAVQLEKRRAQLAFSDKRIAAFEARLNGLKQANEDIERKTQELAGRESVVAAVRAETESVHEIAARAKADLDEVVAQHDEVAAVKGRVDTLLAHLADIDEKIGQVESRKAVVNEVRVQANMIVNMLNDVRCNLETVSEQRAIVNDVAEKVAKLDFAVQEANNVLRALQRERELAERIEQGIQQLRSRTGTDDKKKRA